MESRRREYTTLDRKVLVVAVEGKIKDWAAYIGAVEGKNHMKEMDEVAKHGTKIPKEIARLLFPRFANDFTWRC